MKQLFIFAIVVLLFTVTTSTFAQQTKKDVDSADDAAWQKVEDHYKNILDASLDSVTAYHYKREQLEDAFVEEVQNSELKFIMLYRDSNYSEISKKFSKKILLKNLAREDSILTDFITLVSWWRKGEHVADNPEGSFDLAFAKEASKKVKIAIASLHSKEFTYTEEYVKYMNYIFLEAKVFKITTVER
jgi:hypothetical protein